MPELETSGRPTDWETSNHDDAEASLRCGEEESHDDESCGAESESDAGGQANPGAGVPGGKKKKVRGWRFTA